MMTTQPSMEKTPPARTISATVSSCARERLETFSRLSRVIAPTRRAWLHGEIARARN